MRSVNADKIEPKIILYLEKNVFKKTYLDRALKKMLKNQIDKTKDLKQNTILLEKKLLSVEKKKNKLLILVETTDIDMVDVAER